MSVSKLINLFNVPTHTSETWNSSPQAKYVIPESSLTQGSFHRKNTLSSRSKNMVQPAMSVSEQLIQRGSLPLITPNSIIEGMTGSVSTESVPSVSSTDSGILPQLNNKRNQFNQILQQYNALITSPPVDASSNQAYQTELDSVNGMLISIAKDMYQDVKFAEKEIDGGKQEIEGTLQSLMDQIKTLNEHGKTHDSYGTTMDTLQAEKDTIEQQLQMSNWAFYGLTATGLILSFVVIRNLM